MEGSDDDMGYLLFMALMAHDTTKFDGVMRAWEDGERKKDARISCLLK